MGIDNDGGVLNGAGPGANGFPRRIRGLRGGRNRGNDEAREQDPEMGEQYPDMSHRMSRRKFERRQVNDCILGSSDLGRRGCRWFEFPSAKAKPTRTRK